MSRPITTSPIAPDTLQGSAMQYNPLKDSQESVMRAGFTLLELYGQPFNGNPGLPGRIPVNGNYGGTFNEGSIVTYHPFELPAGLTDWVLMVNLNLLDDGTRVQNVKVELVDVLTTALSIPPLYWAYASGAGAGGVNVGAGHQWLYVTGQFGAVFQPNAGTVQDVYLRLTTTKTNPRTPATGRGVKYWDGVLSLVLKGFRS